MTFAPVIKKTNFTILLLTIAISFKWQYQVVMKFIEDLVTGLFYVLYRITIELNVG